MLRTSLSLSIAVYSQNCRKDKTNAPRQRCVAHSCGWAKQRARFMVQNKGDDDTPRRLLQETRLQPNLLIR